MLAEDAEVEELDMQTFDDELEADEIEITGLIEEPEVAESQIQVLEEELQTEVFDEETEVDEIEITGLTEHPAERSRCGAHRANLSR